jgi:ribosomal protein S19E (S16A)
MRRKNALAEWREWRKVMEAKLEEMGLVPETKLVLPKEGDEVIEEIREEVLEETEEQMD